MARFVRHESCPSCGSRDNLGRYSDGSAWCFGCHYKERASSEKFLPTSGVQEEGAGSRMGGLSSLQRAYEYLLAESPHGTGIPEGVSTYLSDYSITVPEILRNSGGWDGRHERLYFIYRDAAGNPCCIQGRSFRKDQPKYFNQGDTRAVIDLVGDRVNNTCVITEDKLSAIKVGRVCTAFPALGTNFQTHKLIWLQKQGFQNIVVWLDRDKWKEGRDICEKAQWIGMSARAILTDKDPKEYSVEEIKEYLK